MKVKVLLDSAEKVTDFVSITAKTPCDIDLISGKNTYLDAKSIMGIFSLDLSKPIALNIYADDKDIDEILTALEPYLV